MNGQSTDPSPKQAISPSGNDSPVAKASTFCNSKPASCTFPSFLTETRPISNSPISPIVIFAFFILYVFIAKVWLIPPTASEKD
ncbi:hypothetical protein BF0462 [Bacteroides fragilis YCH46]|uniref:Transmembrane protein n=1 Tax=Bacteroides fragilis (strain YCH46) TaxID=295405 RepID=Q64Z65_BACFR|nr:hypothetical protein BF0462 [Bacteroides fragilis YCH46]